MSKEKIKEEIALLNKQDIQEIKDFVGHISTDDSGDHNSGNSSFERHKTQKLPIIDQKYFLGNEWGNCDLSKIIEEKRFGNLKEIFKLTDLGDGDALREVALAMCNSDYKSEQSIDPKVAVSIFGEIVDQLDIMGESTADIIDSYNLA
jgi:hypothetical protein